MKGTAKKQLSGQFKRLRSRLETWRGGRKRGERIPTQLWEAAVDAAGDYGVYRVSQELGLDYTHLKRRLGEASSPRATGASTEALFVEVETNTAATNACVMELEKGNGTRMRICVRDAGTVDWCWLKDAFLEA